jgi:predicted esterase
MTLLVHTIPGAQADRLMVLIHGLGSNENDLPQLIPHLDPTGQFTAVAPRGPIDFMGGYAWFESLQEAPGPQPEAVRSSVAALDAMIDEQCQKLASSVIRQWWSASPRELQWRCALGLERPAAKVAWCRRPGLQALSR